MHVDQLVWRQIPQGSQPCHLNWILHARGRWNREGDYGALYTAFHPFGSLLEYSKYLGKLNLVPDSIAPRDLVSIRVSVSPVLDVRQDDWIQAYDHWPATVLGDSDTCLENCRSIADDAIALGFRALRVPSAILPSMPALDNLVIYPNGPARNLTLTDGPDRFPIGLSGTLPAEAREEIFRRYPDLALPGMDLWG